MKLASITATGHGALDALISQAAAELQAQGACLGGVVKVADDGGADGHYCHADLQVLPDGPQIRITQDLGPNATACRLDAGALASAVAEVERRADGSLDLFVLNKFGPEESNGRGFCAAIGAALERGVPVLVGVGAANREAFEQFAGGMAETLPADITAIRDWCRQAIDAGSARA